MRTLSESYYNRFDCCIIQRSHFFRFSMENVTIMRNDIQPFEFHKELTVL